MFTKLIIFTIVSFGSYANENCLIIKEKDVITKEGDCAKRYSPCSSFKVALSLIGYDTKNLIDETHPKLFYKPTYEAFQESWKEPQNPMSWIKNSCVWYSQELTLKLGIKKFQEYVTKFNYGNKDISGDKGRNNGLTNSWLSSSLEISPEEQIIFLEKLLTNKLPVSEHAHHMTKNILYVEDLPKGWKFYGKTGSGRLLNDDRTKKLDIKHGWFIGWIEKDDKKIIFANHIVDSEIKIEHVGQEAKKQVKEKLLQLIDQK